MPLQKKCILVILGIFKINILVYHKDSVFAYWRSRICFWHLWEIGNALEDVQGSG